MCRIIGPADQAVDRRAGGGVPGRRRRVGRRRRRGPRSAAAAASKSPTSSRSSSSVTTGRHQLAPSLVVSFDAQQVEQQRQVEGAQRARRHRSPARRCTRSGGSSLTCSTSMACVRAVDSSRPYVCRRRRTRPSTTSAAFRRCGSRPIRSLRCCRAARPGRPPWPEPAGWVAAPHPGRAPGTPGSARSVAVFDSTTIARDEAGHRAVGHVADQFVQQLRAFVAFAALIEQAHEHFGRELSDGRREIAERVLALFWIAARHRFDDTAHQTHEGSRAGGDAGAGPAAASIAAISSVSFWESAATPSSSEMAASSRSSASPCRQLAISCSQTAGSPPARSRRTSA